MEHYTVCNKRIRPKRMFDSDSSTVNPKLDPSQSDQGKCALCSSNGHRWLRNTNHQFHKPMTHRGLYILVHMRDHIGFVQWRLNVEVIIGVGAARSKWVDM